MNKVIGFTNKQGTMVDFFINGNPLYFGTYDTKEDGTLEFDKEESMDRVNTFIGLKGLPKNLREALSNPEILAIERDLEAQPANEKELESEESQVNQFIAIIDGVPLILDEFMEEVIFTGMAMYMVEKDIKEVSSDVLIDGYKWTLANIDEVIKSDNTMTLFLMLAYDGVLVTAPYMSSLSGLMYGLLISLGFDIDDERVKVVRIKDFMPELDNINDYSKHLKDLVAVAMGAGLDGCKVERLVDYKKES